MQNSHLYRRGIVLPLDDDAEMALRANDVNDAIQTQCLKIDDAGGFEKLWDAGVFAEINMRCKVLTGDYEEEFLEFGSMDSLLAAVDSMAATVSSSHPETVEFLDNLRGLAQQASSLKRPLLFVL